MRYSTHIGIAATIALVMVCFAPWVYIPSIKTTITGFFADGTNYGHPGLMHCIMGFFAIVFFLFKRVVAKRANIFFCGFNFAWSLRNFLLITHCELGECPEKRWGIYFVVILSFLMMLLSFLPDTKQVHIENKD